MIPRSTRTNPPQAWVPTAREAPRTGAPGLHTPQHPWTLITTSTDPGDDSALPLREEDLVPHGRQAPRSDTDLTPPLRASTRALLDNRRRAFETLSEGILSLGERPKRNAGSRQLAECQTLGELVGLFHAATVSGKLAASGPRRYIKLRMAVTNGLPRKLDAWRHTAASQLAALLCLQQRPPRSELAKWATLAPYLPQTYPADSLCGYPLLRGTRQFLMESLATIERDPAIDNPTSEAARTAAGLREAVLRVEAYERQANVWLADTLAADPGFEPPPNDAGLPASVRDAVAEEMKSAHQDRVRRTEKKRPRPTDPGHPRVRGAASGERTTDTGPRPVRPRIEQPVVGPEVQTWVQIALEPTLPPMGQPLAQPLMQPVLRPAVPSALERALQPPPEGLPIFPPPAEVQPPPDRLVLREPTPAVAATTSHGAGITATRPAGGGALAQGAAWLLNSPLPSQPGFPFSVLPFLEAMARGTGLQQARDTVASNLAGGHRLLAFLMRQGPGPLRPDGMIAELALLLLEEEPDIGQPERMDTVLRGVAAMDRLPKGRSFKPGLFAKLHHAQSPVGHAGLSVLEALYNRSL